MQDIHCDVQEAFKYGPAAKKFPFTIFIGLEKYSFIDYIDMDTKKPERVTISRDDVLFLRGDIPHCGTENMTSHDHYRIHAYVDPPGLKEDDKSDPNETVNTTYEMPMEPYFSVFKDGWSREDIGYLRGGMK